MVDQALCAKDVVKEYKLPGGSALGILQGVSISVYKGEIVVIVGASGAGKSTLLHILGLLDKPTSGEIFYNGVNLSKLSQKDQAERRNRIFGFVFQSYHLLPDFTSLENVLMPVFIARSFGNKDLSKKEYTDKAKALLDQAGLGGRVNHRPDQLSGGEKQRVAIARALINDPEVLLCDEPTGNLDSKTGQEIQELIWDINERVNQTVIIVTHDSLIERNAQRAIHIADGKIVN